ncbi:MAG: cytochrome C biogenesis protein [Cyanobacteria bacterium J06626_23]
MQAKFSSLKLSELPELLGSIKLAVPLLVAIATILVGATFYESEVGSAVVQQTIYKSPWFGALMFMLALNLGISTLLRYPWRGARKIGFALTHWGLVVIIAGSAAVIHLSVEGMLLARTDAGPVNTLRVEGDLLEVAAPGQAVEQASLFIKSDGTVVPDRLGSLALLDYSRNTIKTVRFEEGATVENPAVQLTLSSDRMGQSLARWVAAAPAAYSQLEVGPATLQIIKAETDSALKQALSPPDEQAPMHPFGTLTASWAGASRVIDVKTEQQKPIAMGQDQLKVVNFWPDFRLDSNHMPGSASAQLLNPAVEVVLDRGEATESWYVFANAAFDPIRSSGEGILAQDSAQAIDAAFRYEVTPTVTSPDAFFRVVVAAAGELHYAARSSKGFKSGALTIGETVVPGWADFKVTLSTFVSHAQVKRDVVPLPETASADSGEPALLVSAAGSDPTWVPWGEATTLNTPTGDWYVSFSPKLLQLPFGVKLDDFIVERNEGSESVAMWTSVVRLIDLYTGQIADRRVWMNHPTWFKGWKLAQASWNPGDLNQSTLQVKREPWWVTGLTWLGSLMVTAGICTMFYGRAVAKKLKGLSGLLGPEPEPEPETAGTIPIFNFFTGR